MHWLQTTVMAVVGEISPVKKKKIKDGVRQEYRLSLELFSLYSEMIIPSLEGYPRTKVGVHKVNWYMLITVY